MVPRRPLHPLPLDCPRRVEGARLTRGALTADRCQTASRRAGRVCGMLHRLAWIYNRGAPYILYYNRAAVLTCIASGRGACIWYQFRTSGRVCAIQRGAGGIIAACVGFVFSVVEWDKPQEKRL